MLRFQYFVLSSGIIILISVCIAAFGDLETINKKTTAEENWIGSWSTSMQAQSEEEVSKGKFENQTIRMIVKPHLKGNKMRIRLSNTFGSEPISFEEVNVAESKQGAETVPNTDRKVTFGGSKKVTIPQGKRVFSDPVYFEVPNNKKLAISLYIKDETGPTSWHPHSMQTTYISDSGNHVSTSDDSAYKTKEEAWFWLDGVDVIPDSDVEGAVVVLGSSIANGNHSKTNEDHRWPDYLAERFNKDSKANMSVLNAGLSANLLINSSPEKGENALARMEQDVFLQSGVKAVILHQGLNDIRHYPEYDADKIIEKMKEIIAISHKQGLKIYGGTLTPFKGSGMYTREKEKTRKEVNEWIRTSGAFDGTIDFDKSLRDPDDPESFHPDYDAGDHLHPNDAGYKKMAESVDLSMFK
ncbi:SGNH/GDSL hydrolase family protein [Pseudalkalibacillus berkeleyi]|uniref:SGNH/GDSL hydrolase family protein n=1 Tax=Pseudalkalibacillus berkeleyi TaxID=1069813 RepID=A0ABS9H3P6_9BACL|nr:SGNH/GDSL hydrolase family protein [Pseudalkalibacillus berkeleyi]MCF6138561.1 SGNH/GDSL hydrolase family protein [Pseudalkalibacillus berkeleyi]